MLMEAYIRIITGEGPTYQDQLQQWIRFLEYGEDLAVGPLHTHRHNQNGMGRGDQYRTPPPTPKEAHNYSVSLLKTREVF